MSLPAYALAFCATGALVELLPDWVKVVYGQKEPVEAAEAAASVLAAVFIGDETRTIKGRKWSSADHTVELVLQVILPARVRAALGGAVCEFDTKEGGTDGLYTLADRTVERMFTEPGPAGSWRELLQSVWVGHPEPVHGMPGKAERPGKVPVPLKDFSIPCSVIQSPAFGQPAPYPWPDISAKMRADEAFTAAEADFFDALVAATPLTDELAELALAGLSRSRGAALGLAPFAGLDESPATTALKIVGPFGADVETAGA